MKEPQIANHITTLQIYVVVWVDIELSHLLHPRNASKDLQLYSQIHSY